MKYTTEQNGVAQMDLRTLVQAARTSLHHQENEKCVWKEVIKASFYVLDRTSTSSALDKKPFELIILYLDSQFIPTFNSEKNGIGKPSYSQNAKGCKVYSENERKIEIYIEVIIKQRR